MASMSAVRPLSCTGMIARLRDERMGREHHLRTRPDSRDPQIQFEAVRRISDAHCPPNAAERGQLLLERAQIGLEDVRARLGGPKQRALDLGAVLCEHVWITEER